MPKKKLCRVRLALCHIPMAGDIPPEWIQLVPAGKIDALDGRHFENTLPADVISAFAANPTDLPIDYEHATELKAPKGEEAPAAGWIKELESRDGEIWGRVEWTPKGEASLKGKEYRYLSPAFYLDKAKRIIELISAGLTNRPAFDMPALANTLQSILRPDSGVSNQQPDLGGMAQATVEESMDPKLLKMLGLAEDASVEDTLAAVSKLQEDGEKTQTELATAQKSLTDKSEELAAALAQEPSLDKFVPRSDYDAVVAWAEQAEKTIADERQASLEQAVEAEIDAALKAGKITPATVDYHKAQCRDEEGLTRLREFVKTAPVVAADSKLDDEPLPESGNAQPTAEELAIAARCGVNKEQFAAARAEQA